MHRIVQGIALAVVTLCLTLAGRPAWAQQQRIWGNGGNNHVSLPCKDLQGQAANCEITVDISTIGGACTISAMPVPHVHPGLQIIWTVSNANNYTFVDANGITISNNTTSTNTPFFNCGLVPKQAGKKFQCTRLNDTAERLAARAFSYTIYLKLGATGAICSVDPLIVSRD